MNLTVHLGSRTYPILLEEGNVSLFPKMLRDMFPKSRFALVTNTVLADLYAPLLNQWSSELDLAIHTIPDGEAYKTLQTWGTVLDFLLRSNLERSSVIIAFGGGVTGDITGFAAAAFLRGVAFVQVPTTLLAMIDSSVGGKTAVDHPQGKNLIGAFHQPRLVFVDTSFLQTLPKREFISGYAELFKNAFIGGREMFDFVSAFHERMIVGESQVLLEGIYKSIAIKARVVEQDECETKGLRAILNFGHTFAHSLEKFFNFRDLLHGEAVFWGMKCACELGYISGTVKQADIPLYQALLSRMVLPELPSKVEPEKIYSMMFSDKKVESGKLRLVLPAEPGTSVVRNDIPANDIISVLERVFS